MPKTYAPRFDLAAEFDWLEPKTTVRLHPRQGAPTGAFADKMGGEIAWPADEDWPCCDEHPESELLPVLQLRADSLPELEFAEGADLFQMLWCPRDHASCGYAPKVWTFWRGSSSNLSARAPSRVVASTDDYVVEACRLSPERVVEYPDPAELSWEQHDQVSDWLAEHALQDLEALGIEPDEPGDPANYQYHFSAAPGTKVGGYPRWVQDAQPMVCTCGNPMAHLVTIASAEFDGAWQRWLPEEDRGVRELPYDERRKVQRAAGLMLGDMGNLYVYECRVCEGRPVWPLFQCS